MVASEVSPWARLGALADVTSALPEALDRLGHDVTIVIPRYRASPLADPKVLTRRITLGAMVYDVAYHVERLSSSRRIVMVDVPALFDRDGQYGAGGRDFEDNAERFGLLSAAALEFAERDVDGRAIDVVHAHDWQAGLAPTLLRVAPDRYPATARAGTAFTIHNLSYQGLFPPEVVPALGLPWSVFAMETGEFYGRFSFLKAGVSYGDYITTVSPSYAEETTRAEFGAGMEGMLSGQRDYYVGVLNGIDTKLWDPATDPFLPAHFDLANPDGKIGCKRALLERFHLAFGDDALARPLVATVSRFAQQKGLDLIEHASDVLTRLDATWVFVGTGDPDIEMSLRGLAARHPTRVGVHVGRDEPLAHLVQAGADILLMPSRSEPCGFHQMRGLRYGTVPVVRAVGGLDDTIQPYIARARGANGFKFRETTPEALVRAVRQAVRLYHDKVTWRRLMQNGMAADHSWETSAKEYVKVYRRARHAATVRSGR